MWLIGPILQDFFQQHRRSCFDPWMDHCMNHRSNLWQLFYSMLSQLAWHFGDFRPYWPFVGSTSLQQDDISMSFTYKPIFLLAPHRLKSMTSLGFSTLWTLPCTFSRNLHLHETLVPSTPLYFHYFWHHTSLIAYQPGIFHQSGPLQILFTHIIESMAFWCLPHNVRQHFHCGTLTQKGI